MLVSVRGILSIKVYFLYLFLFFERWGYMFERNFVIGCIKLVIICKLLLKK